jgi:hypothetical protein
MRWLREKGLQSFRSGDANSGADYLARSAYPKQRVQLQARQNATHVGSRCWLSRVDQSGEIEGHSFATLG